MAVEAKKRLVAKCKIYVDGPLKQGVEQMLGRQNVDVLRATLQAWATWNSQLVCLVSSRKNGHVSGELTLPRDTLIGSFATSTARTYCPNRNPSVT
jgi:hypothetical protein